jgi:hypothetical protein
MTGKRGCVSGMSSRDEKVMRCIEELAGDVLTLYSWPS